MGEKKDKKNENIGSAFFALVFRQKYINRWNLMRNASRENLAQHACECAVITHALAVIGNEIFGENYDVGKSVTLAIYHDVPEVFTGDMPTPIKYANSLFRREFKNIEKQSADNLMEKLPEHFKKHFRELFYEDNADPRLVKLVKAADKLCAYLKCVEEEKFNNHEFKFAKISVENQLKELKCKESDYFLENFAEAFKLTLDEQQQR